MNGKLLSIQDNLDGTLDLVLETPKGKQLTFTGCTIINRSVTLTAAQPDTIIMENVTMRPSEICEGGRIDFPSLALPVRMLHGVHEDLVPFGMREPSPSPLMDIASGYEPKARPQRFEEDPANRPDHTIGPALDVYRNIPISRTCPDGTITTDEEAYAKAWCAIGDAVLAFFPGYVLAAVNPGIVLERRETNRDGRYTCVDSIRLSVLAANCLINHKEPQRQTRED